MRVGKRHIKSRVLVSAGPVRLRTVPVQHPPRGRRYGRRGWWEGVGGATLGGVNQDIRIPELAPAARRFSIQWPASRHNAHRARTAAVGRLRAWGLPHEAASHIVAELAANAVVHGRVPGRDFRLTLVASAAVLRIEVADARGDRLPVAAREADDAAESGRGLLLVEALADRWGVTSGPSPTKTVWAELDLARVPAGGTVPAGGAVPS